MTTTRPPVDEPFRDAYLRRLGFATPPPASVETLYALHRAQVERIPYEAVWIWLGERRTIDPLDSLRYLVSGRGGYCYHLNGALATLLGWLGFVVHWHTAGVQSLREDAAANVDGNHLAITVSDLPSDANPGGEWLVDAGLGDGPHEPMPLLTGTCAQGPHTYRLRPSEIAPGGWRFDADPSMSLRGMDFKPEEATPADLRERHEHLQSSPDSGFVRTLALCRRDATGVDVLRGRVLTSHENKIELDTRADWYACLADVFNLPLSDVDETRRTTLWEKVTATHENWLASAAEATTS
ncbi:arylamine N-acetyltransferase family protein [Actinophytocola sp.]|uniref:arylamine N-acetyltransferase family protein n=1 Tax=Actinophytocola sp. TaxID=1872138 RepID=UPI00389A3A77